MATALNALLILGLLLLVLPSHVHAFGAGSMLYRTVYRI